MFTTDSRKLPGKPLTNVSDASWHVPMSPTGSVSLRPIRPTEQSPTPTGYSIIAVEIGFRQFFGSPDLKIP